MATQCTRRIYIDLGVNWCNTILQYRQYEPANASTAKYAGWEVFGFEASPLIQPYVEDHMAWLDGRRSDKPISCLPSAGSSKNLAKWAPHYGCPTAPAEPMRKCVWTKLAPHLAALKPSPRLNRTTLVDARLKTASMRRCGRGVSSSRARFTFVPAAAAGPSSAGFMWIWSPPEQTIRGGGHPFNVKPGWGISKTDIPTEKAPKHHSEPGGTTGWFKVRAVDVSGWIQASFSPLDHVVLKMDIEGGEFPLMREMIRSNALSLVDVLFLECHSDGPADCMRLKREVRRVNPFMQMLQEERTFKDERDVDPEARVPSSEEMASRMRACDAAVAGGYSLSKPVEAPQAVGSNGEDDTATEMAQMAEEGPRRKLDPIEAISSRREARQYDKQQSSERYDGIRMYGSGGGGGSAECRRLHRSYNNYTLRGPCPFDRHLVEALSYLDGCPPPGLRLCHTPAPLTPQRRSGTADEALNDRAVEWRSFKPLRHFGDAATAATTGKLPGILEPKDGQTWAAVEFPPDAARLKWRRYIGRLGTFVPLDTVRVAIDVGGGAGHFGAVLKSMHPNVSTITLTKDNSIGPKYYFDLPFVEMAVNQGGIALLWSATRRLPLPDRSIDMIHSRMAVPMSLDSDVNEGQLYDWDRMLKPGGHIVFTSDVSRYLTGNDPNPDTRFAELLPQVAQRLGWEAVCKRKAKKELTRDVTTHQLTKGCQIDDRGKIPSQVFRKPV